MATSLAVLKPEFSSRKAKEVEEEFSRIWAGMGVKDDRMVEGGGQGKGRELQFTDKIFTIC